MALTPKMNQWWNVPLYLTEPDEAVIFLCEEGDSNPHGC